MTSNPHWCSLDVPASLNHLKVRREGLGQMEAERRLEKHGPNRIAEKAAKSIWQIILAQFKELLVVILIVAAVISGLVGEPQDSVIILAIVALNGVIGAIQEYRAERALSALRKMAAPTTQVLRNGHVVVRPATDLVPGDIVLLEAGSGVPADVRLIETSGLAANESLLTGESQPVEKNSCHVLPADTRLVDRTNFAFKGTSIARGTGRGLVVTTGMSTELGQIAGLLEGAERRRTPLQQRLHRFARRLAVAVVLLCFLIFALGIARGEPTVLMLLTAVSLAVAAVPEALPAVTTVSLAIGASLMGRSNALMRNLPAVETLGSVTYICADKTGTLTENQMRIEKIVLGETSYDGFPHGNGPVCAMLGNALALSNDITEDENDQVLGDPTEVALFEAAQNAGFRKSELAKRFARSGNLPFSSERKMMSTFHSDQGDLGDQTGILMFCKGAPEIVVPRCNGQMGTGRFDRAAIMAKAESLAEQGYRVLAVSYRRFDEPPRALSGGLENDLTLIAIAALIDPPRDGAEQAVAECKAAGIVPVMITGDHPGTARSIARRLGIIDDHAPVLTGIDLQELDAEGLRQAVADVSVYARVDPAQKIRIVEALQTRGEFVAMTGDGVNDAPALKCANIGIAMGLKGTDVAREAADLVLLDDNFATIVCAIREGRRIYGNIRKFIKYTMTSNSGEIWVLLLAPFLGLPLPLLPIHILWINLVTDGLPGLALTAERAEPTLMREPPRPPDESIFAHGMWQHIIWVGLLIGAISLGAQAWTYFGGGGHWQTVVFTVLTLAQLFHCLAIRTERTSLVTVGIFSNPPMIAALLITVALQLAVIYLPVLNGLFHTQPLPLFDLILCFALASTLLVAVEIEKLLVRRETLY